VRWSVILCFVFLWVPASRAQHQEPSLVDRLLRPNLELKNNAQGKKFGANSAVIEKRSTVGTFFLRPNRKEKSFVDVRVLTAPKYSSRSFHEDAVVAASLQNRNVQTSVNLSTSSARDIHDAYDAHNAIAGRGYVAAGPFREQGKSQKSLDRQNPPMTIEQVRELLNKNK
jgi:hypothetical protein